MTDLAPGEAVIVDWDNDRYHADRAHVSNSWLSELIGSPSMYRARRDGLLPFESSSSMAFGTNAHLALLEPDEWRRRLFAPEPAKPDGADGRRKKRSDERVLYEEWQHDRATHALGVAGCPGAIVLTIEERARVESCVAAVREHGEAAQLLARATSFEQTILRRDEDTGILIRHRLDLIADIGPLVVGDLKSTLDPSDKAFARSVHRYGYHRQAAMYVDGLAAVYPDRDIHFVILAVRSRPPFEVACYEIEGDELDQGRREYREALKDLARRREDNDWLAPWQRGINRLTLPRWAFTRDE